MKPEDMTPEQRLATIENNPKQLKYIESKPHLAKQLQELRKAVRGESYDYFDVELSPEEETINELEDKIQDLEDKNKKQKEKINEMYRIIKSIPSLKTQYIRAMKKLESD